MSWNRNCVTRLINLESSNYKQRNSFFYNMNLRLFAGLVAVTLFAHRGLCEGNFDWPQWQGPNRTAHSKATMREFTALLRKPLNITGTGEGTRTLVFVQQTGCLFAAGPVAQPHRKPMPSARNSPIAFQ
jgi:hypothetical protein